MKIRFHPHAQERMRERGTTEEEVRAAIEGGERFPVKYNRTGFRRNFPFDSLTVIGMGSIIKISR